MMPSPSYARAETLLTERQQQCLSGFWGRKSAKQIGLELGISHHAVEKHLLACRERLQVGSSMEAARLVYGDATRPTAQPYYDASEVQEQAFAGHEPTTPTPLGGLEGVTTKSLPINRLGLVPTLVLILAVALGSIIGVSALIASAQGANTLGRSLLS